MLEEKMEGIGLVLIPICFPQEYLEDMEHTYPHILPQEVVMGAVYQRQIMMTEVHYMQEALN